MNAQDPDAVAVTAITVAELPHGIGRLKPGRKRRDLERAIAKTLEDDLLVLPIDDAAAVDYAMIAASQELRRRRVAMADAMIAATCMAAHATLATRNARDFAHLGIEVVDPWRE